MKPFASGLRMCGALVAAVMVTLLAMPGVARADGPLTLRAAINLGYRANDVVLDERAGFPYAYVATDKGLTILNIADPAHPSLVKQLVTAHCNVSCTKGPVAKSQGLAKNISGRTSG